MSAGELEEMAEATDLLPACPVKVVEHEGLEPFGPMPPIQPVPVDASAPVREPRIWKYRTC